MFLNDYGLEKAKSLKEGDMVSWNSSGGRARGKVIHVMDYGTLDIPNTKFKIKGEKDNPAVLIQLYRDGKETDIQVGHKMSSLTKSLDEPLLKHGSHNQKTHAGSRGGGGGSGASSNTTATSRKEFEEKIRSEIGDLEAKVGEVTDNYEDRMEEDFESGDISKEDYDAGQSAIAFASDASQHLNVAETRQTSLDSKVSSLRSASTSLQDGKIALRNASDSLGGFANKLENLSLDCLVLIDGIEANLGLKKNLVSKHASHNQSSHGRKGGGGGGSATSNRPTRAVPTSMPFRPTGKDKLDEALFNRLDRKESNAAYVSGWKTGQAESRDNKLFNAANSWIDMTDKAINEGKMPNDGFLLETARAVGLINGMLQAK